MLALCVSLITTFVCSTCRMICRKYYDLEAYARREAEKAAETGGAERPRRSAAVTDEEALRQQRAMERQKVRLGLPRDFSRCHYHPSSQLWQ